MFVEASYRQSPEYRAFWQKLGRGEFDAGQYKRIGKGGREIWIQASYNPVMDAKESLQGCQVRDRHHRAEEDRRRLRRADRSHRKSQAVIEFKLDGTIVHANENFLKTLGYTLDEIKGRHHSMFAEPVTGRVRVPCILDKLGRGEYDAGQYKRLGKNNKEVWIQATTTQFSTRAASLSRSSNTRPTSPRRFLLTR